MGGPSKATARAHALTGSRAHEYTNLRLSADPCMMARSSTSSSSSSSSSISSSSSFVLPVGVAPGHVYILLAAAVLVLLGIYYA